MVASTTSWAWTVPGCCALSEEAERETNGRDEDEDGGGEDDDDDSEDDPPGTVCPSTACAGGVRRSAPGDARRSAHGDDGDGAAQDRQPGRILRVDGAGSAAGVQRALPGGRPARSGRTGRAV